MGASVMKFGGSSLKGPAGYLAARAAVLQNSDCRAVVVSAPAGITDLLYRLDLKEHRTAAFREICQIFLEIARGIPLDMDGIKEVRDALAEIARIARNKGLRSKAYRVSRGEALSARIFSRLIGWSYVEAATTIRFNMRGEFSLALSRASLMGPLPRFVMGGFYGADKRGVVRIFPRDGSDMSAAVVAVLTGGTLIALGKDTHGTYFVNPRILERSANIRVIERLTYTHALEMTARSTSFVLPSAIAFARAHQVEIEVFNTYDPTGPRTRIVRDGTRVPVSPKHVIGIADQSGFTMITILKPGMNEDPTFSRKVLGVFSSFGIGYDHSVTGIEQLSYVVRDSAIAGRISDIKKMIRHVCRADVIVTPDLSVICIVGDDFSRNALSVSKLIYAIGRCGLHIPFQEYGGTGTSLIVGVPTSKLRVAIDRLYEEATSSR